MSLKSQIVDLKTEGYWKDLLDIFQLDIVVKQWFDPRTHCGCTYHLHVQLASADYIVSASSELHLRSFNSAIMPNEKRSASPSLITFQVSITSFYNMGARNPVLKRLVRALCHQQQHHYQPQNSQEPRYYQNST